MKFLLTSGGIENESIIRSLQDLMGKDFRDSKAVFIPTAANVEEGAKPWLERDISICKKLGFSHVDVIDIASASKDVWMPKMEGADVLIVGGGNTVYLMKEMKKSGFADALPSLLATRVYVGISAGSMVVAPKLKEEQMQRLYDEPVTDDDTNEGLGLVNFLVVPHMNSPHFPRASVLIDEVAKEITDITLYAIDDQTAIKVIDGTVQVVTEGSWKKYN